MKKNVLPLSLLVALLILFRIGGAAAGSSFPNAVPYVAVFFCAVVFARACPMLLPAAAAVWVLGGPVTSLIQGYPVFDMINLVTLLALIACAGVGLFFRERKSIFPLVGGTILAATGFYLVTNFYSFVVDPAYPKTWGGMTMAFWTGHPATNLPTWVFFRNSLCTNVLFTLLFVAAVRLPAFQIAKRFGLAPASTSH